MVTSEYFTKERARVYTSLSLRTLDYARERQQLTFYKVGKKVLFKKSDLDAFLERYRANVDLDRIVDEVMAEVSDGRGNG